MIEFSEEQKHVVVRGLTALSLAIIAGVIFLVGWGLLKFLVFSSAAIVPIAFGFFLALFFKPYYLWWKRLVRNPTVALLVMLATVFVPLGILIWYAGAVLVDQAFNLIAQGPELVHQVLHWLQTTFPKLYSFLAQVGVAPDNLSMIYAKYGTTALKAGTSALKCLTSVVSVLVTLLFFIFFLMTKDRRGGEMVSEMPFLKDETKGFLAEQIDSFVEILVSFFQRQVVICLIEGTLYGFGFWVVGLPYGFLIGFLLGVMNLIPFFGSVVCLPIALPLAYFSHGGSLTRLLLVVGVWLTGQMLDGYFITPKIQGDKTGLGYLGVIFSFFFWSTVLGPLLGMLLAIPLSAFCVVFWRALKSRYLKPIV